MSQTISLSNLQKKHLKSLAHHLKPILWVGQNGLSEAVLEEVKLALAHHELVKISLKVGDKEARAACSASICELTGAVLIQQIGATASFYLKNIKNPKITLPK